jgi:hypothetical protein
LPAARLAGADDLKGRVHAVGGQLPARRRRPIDQGDGDLALQGSVDGVSVGDGGKSPSKRYLNKELFTSTSVGLFRADYDDESNGYGVVIDDDDIGLRPADRSDERPPVPKRFGPEDWTGWSLEL